MLSILILKQVSRLHTVVVNNERHTEGSMINMGAGA